jgi:hypothetical protein
MSFIIASPGSGAGGGGAFTSITGTPTEVAYFDALGNGTSDSLFTRDALGNTEIFTDYTDYNMGFSTADNFFGGFLATGIEATADDESSSGVLKLVVLPGGGGGDVPTGVFKFEGYTNAEGTFMAIQSGSGVGRDYEFYSTGTTVSEGINSLGYIFSVLNENGSTRDISTIRMNTEKIENTFSEAVSPSTPAIVAKTQVSRDGASLIAYNGKKSSLQTQVDINFSGVAFTGTGVDDLSPVGTFAGSDPVKYTYIYKGVGERIAFEPLDMQTFEIGDTVTGGTSGATGVVVVTGNSRVFVNNMTGTFQLGESISNGTLTSPEITSLLGQAPIAVYEVEVDGVIINSSGAYLTTGTFTPTNSFGIGVTWGSVSGHDLDAQWVFTYSAKVVDRNIAPAKEFPIENNLSVNIFTLDLPIGSMASGFVEWSVNATDTATYQVRTVRRAWTAVNTGTITVDIGAATGGVSASTGTLASGLAGTAGTNEVTFSIDAVSSLTDPDIYAFVQITNNSKQNITVLY